MIKRILVSVILLAFFAQPGYAKASPISAVWFPVVSGSAPGSIVPDSTTSVWFGMDLLSVIGHMDTQGNVQYYRVDKPVSSMGRDKSGNIWFTYYRSGMGFIDGSSKHITTYAVSGYNLTYTLGAMWFLTGAHGYGSIASNSNARLYKLPQDFDASHMAAGPDGSLWITDTTHNTIGKVLPGSSLVTAYALSDNSQPEAITSGPESALWFIDAQGIGRITTTGKITQFNHTHAVFYGDIKSGPNNTLWYIWGADGANTIAYMTISGKITIANTELSGRGGGGDFSRVGNVMWFTDTGGDRIGHTTS